jgi:hypothetical protein
MRHSALLAMLIAHVCAQSFTSSFHVYIHPVLGDDALATAQNPKGLPSSTPGSRPLQEHPAFPAIQGTLKHAPYAFRTIRAAVDYIESWPKKDPGTGRSLPYINDTISPHGTVDFVVLHLAPGLYGPRRAVIPPQSEEYHTENGHPWNGEVFPIELPPRVCLQGTSALDTILDARGYEHAEFQNRSILSLGELVFDNNGQPRTAAAAGYAWSFLDSLTIRGTLWTTSAPQPIGGVIIDGPPTGENGVAIALRGPLGIAPSISNCIITGNQIGVGLFDPDPSLDVGNHHAPRIVGNTFVWNNIGLYSRYQQGSIGTSRPLILNNLFDAVLPELPISLQPPRWLAPSYVQTEPLNFCFEGIDPTDLVAFVPGCLDPTTGQPPLSRSFNAYLIQHCNAGTHSRQFPVLPRSGVVAVPPPVVDLLAAGISPSGFYSSPRPDFYVRDVMANAAFPQSVSNHDFRLAPSFTPVGGTLAVPNPLVNMGISLRGGPIEFRQFNQTMPPTTVSITSPPGAPADDLALFHCWDWDCEGFGNPRDVSRTLDPGNPAVHFPEPFACAGKVDLGADEVGELVVAGYLDDSRIFTKAHLDLIFNTGKAVQTLSFQDASTLYFLNVMNPLGGPTVYPAPQFNLRHDSAAIVPPTTVSSAPPFGSGDPIGAEWFAQLGPTHNPFVVPGIDPPLPFAHTSGQHRAFALPTEKSMRFELVRTGPIASHYPTFTRSRIADIGGHVMESIFLDSTANIRDVDYAEFDFLCPGIPLNDREQDIFQANPWFDMGDFGSDPGTNDNKFLYPNFAFGRRLRHGTLNPPMTMF